MKKCSNCEAEIFQIPVDDGTMAWVDLDGLQTCESLEWQPSEDTPAHTI